VNTRLVRLAILSAMVAMVALLPACRTAVAADSGAISGTIRDDQGRPWPNITVAAEVEGQPGTAHTATTDADGKYKITGLASGTYLLNISQGSELIFQVRAKVSAGSETPADISFKDPQIAKASAELRKHNAEINKGQALKAHFDAGDAALTQAKALHQQGLQLKGDDKAALDAKIQPLSAQAVAEFQAALPLTGEKDNNRFVILERLGESYETGGQSDEAVKYYQQAADLKPDPGLYNNLGNMYAKLGKLDEAKAAYEKSAELDPANAASAYRNFGITLYNANKLKEAVEPLRKATQLDPNNAQGWYLLGAALVGAMEYKQEGEKITPIMQPGTVEAYQKCIELDPNGPWGKQAQEGLEQLKAMGLGIDTKVRTGKKNQ
jgi:tetratricopeptide (TPR) repeat protein